MLNKNKKLISALLIILIIVPAVLLSRPKQAYAVAPVQDVGALAILRNIFLGTTGASTAINTGNTVKNTLIAIAKQAIMVIEQRLLQEMTKSMVNWINSGFHGSPLFLTNSDSFFHDIAKTEIKNIVSDFGYDPNKFPFGQQFALNIINSYKRTADQDASYSLSAFMSQTDANNFRNNFNAGGWNGFLINTQYPQNNYLGFNMMATDKLAHSLAGTTQTAAQKVQTTLQQGMGFLSPTTCPKNINASYDNGINEFDPPVFQPTVSSDLTSQIDQCYGPVGSVSAPRAVSSCITAVNASYQKELATEKAAFNAKSSCINPNTGQSGLVATTPGSVAAN